MSNQLVTIDEERFRERFKDVFDCFKELSTETFYNILKAPDVDFNENAAIQRVKRRLRYPSEYRLPLALLNDPPITSQRSSPLKRIRGRRPSPVSPVDDSDDDFIQSIKADDSQKSSTVTPEFLQRPKFNGLSNRRSPAENEDEDEDDEEDIRPPKRRVTSSHSRNNSFSNPRPGNNGKCHKSTLFRGKKMLAKPYKSPNSTTLFNEDSDSDFGSEKFYTPNHFPDESDEFRVGGKTSGPLHQGRESSIPIRSKKRNQQQERPTVDIPEDIPYIELTDSDEYDEESLSDSHQTPESGESCGGDENPCRNRTQKGNLSGKRKIDDEVLEHRIPTRATPLIRKLAGDLFSRNIAPAEGDILDLLAIDDLVNITCDPAASRSLRQSAWRCTQENGNIKFIGRSTWYDSKTGRNGFEAALIDGVTYRAGDCVLINAPDPDDFKMKQKEASNKIDEDDEGGQEIDTVDPWYARIIYLCEDEDGEKVAHLQWFEHGSETIMGEMAGPRELFLLTHCDFNTLACIAGKIKVDFVAPDEEHASGAIETRFHEKNHYFYRFHYDPEKQMFKDASPHEDPLSTCQSKELNQGPKCNCCREIKDTAQCAATLAISEVARDGSLTEFRHRGINYRLHDFVYIAPVEGKLSKIGQIVAIDLPSQLLESDLGNKDVCLSISIRIRFLKRFNHTHRQWFDDVKAGDVYSVRDERRLYFTKKVTRIAAERLDGKCEVRHVSHISDLEKYKDGKDAFWVRDKVPEFSTYSNSNRAQLEELNPEEIKYSKLTNSEFSRARVAAELFERNGERAAALELFAGCGGLSLGLHLSGAVETKWAVEISPSAAKTFSRNFPKAKVYNEDGSTCLTRAIEKDKGIEADGNKKDMSGYPVLPMPRRRGEVFMIVAGFPCPGYSGANQHPRHDDIKNTLILLVLSYIDFFRPKYVLLENVVGILQHKLRSRQASKSKTEGGILQGTLKFILRALTCMGYQVEFTTLQAGEFSTPQSRRRVFFWAALPGYELPKFPQPTSTFSGVCPTSWHRSRQSAPHPEVTVGDAVTDLPGFDWVNPHNLVPRSMRENLDRLDRTATIEQLHVLPGQDFVGHDKQPYASNPLCEYQRKLRRGLADNQLVNHVTHNWFDNPSWSNKNKGLQNARTEQVCNIPFTPDADHRKLPMILKPWSLSHRDSAAAKYNFYPGRIGRLDMEKPFQTCLTRVEINGKNGRILHPTQHRILSIREQARAQGYPDDFTWDLDNIEVRLAYRMIGNAVPVTLSLNVGHALHDIQVAKFYKAYKEKISITAVTDEARRVAARVLREGGGLTRGTL